MTRQIPADPEHLYAPPVSAQRGHHLAEEFLPGPQPDQIVDQAGGEDQSRRRKQFPDQRHISLDNRAAA